MAVTLSSSTVTQLILVDASSGAVTVDLKTTGTRCPDVLHVIKKIDSSTNAVTIKDSGGSQIEGQSTFALGTTNDAITVMLDGSTNTWRVVSGDAGFGAGYIPYKTSSGLLANSPIYTNGSSLSFFTNSTSAPVNLIYNGGEVVLMGYSTTTALPFIMGKAPFIGIVGNGNDNQNPNIGLLQVNIGDTYTYQSASEIYLGATRSSTATPGVAVGNGDILGRIGFFGDDGTNLRTRGALIQVFVDTTYGSVSTGNIPGRLSLVTGNAPITFHTNVTGLGGGIGAVTTNERMRILPNGNVLIGTTSDNGNKLQVNGSAWINGSFSSPIKTVTAAYTLTSSDSTVLANASSAAFTVTLPDATTCSGREYVIKKIDSSANAVTVGVTGTQTIDGASSRSLASQYKYITVQSDGSNWYIIANN